MTFFMHRLAEVLGAPEPQEAPEPALRPSLAVARNEGTDRQVVLRSLAEQLVCEANAVIEDPASHMDLADEVGGEDLAFTITCRDHRARVSTSFRGGRTVGRIISSDLPQGEAHELVGPEALPDLLVRLAVVAGLRNTESAHLS
ncbi:hypothetical protein [Raineyella fluvialis]|uniref:Uncharacterized protein n=1 Tax=Raineyella fluvialis TaxID=2662261 RepID=A0A5Q2FAS7_9ACTN|nr:hypothetical protein [Raineyella fluvialis]QGF23491.1 hypothetical protein Rai3103_07200 [Raineyella fluvialis]